MKTHDDLNPALEAREHRLADCDVQGLFTPLKGQRSPWADPHSFAPMPAEACTEIGFDAAPAQYPLTRLESGMVWVVVVGSGGALVSMVAALLPL